MRINSTARNIRKRKFTLGNIHNIRIIGNSNVIAINRNAIIKKFKAGVSSGIVNRIANRHRAINNNILGRSNRNATKCNRVIINSNSARATINRAINSANAINRDLTNIQIARKSANVNELRNAVNNSKRGIIISKDKVIIISGKIIESSLNSNVSWITGNSARAFTNINISRAINTNKIIARASVDSNIIAAVNSIIARASVNVNASSIIVNEVRPMVNRSVSTPNEDIFRISEMMAHSFSSISLLGFL